MMDASTLHPLRQRMIDDMTLRGFGVATQRCYIAAVRRCTAHVRKPPGALLPEDARAFLLHLQANGASVSS
jgi:integrase/recombinase XerD